MANVEATLIQNLIDEIQTLIAEIKNAGEAGRTKLKDINVALCQDVLGNNTKLTRKTGPSALRMNRIRCTRGWP
jgi:hypothetical protein